MACQSPNSRLYKRRVFRYNRGKKGGDAMAARQETVCFSGYRPDKLPWGEDESDLRCAMLKERLYQAVCDACDEGFRHFICGMARGVDLYAGEAVLRARVKYPDITLEAAIPCPTQPDSWPESERQRWQSLVDRCDFETMVQQQYSQGCMQRRNRYMVDHSARLIAVYDGQSGGTQQTVEYALRRELELVLVEM